MFPMIKITIYHKENDGFQRYNKMASFRDTSTLRHEQAGEIKENQVKIRIFDFDGYDLSWKCDKGDIIVSKDVKDIIELAPITELSKKYGRDNVYEVQSIDRYLFGEELDHIKIICK